MRLAKNMSLAATTAMNHLADDPVVLALQISRRLPATMVAPAAKLITRALPRSTSALALLAIHMTGDMERLESKLAGALTRKLSANRARLAADVALAAGMPEWADKFLPLATGARRFPSTHARRKWYDGDMRGAVEALAGQPGAMQRQRERLAGEWRTYSGWRASLVPATMEPVSGRVLHFLTNSLPHTTSGYAQRTHSILTAQQDAGAEVLAVTRLGYPVQLGKIFAAGEDVVDGVRYRRMIPSRLAKTADARLQQEVEELFRVALEFRPEVLHTTTHFTNGLVVGAVAKALGIPWVYEVRGQLADTWASTRDEAAKSSEKYCSFQNAETSVMLDADSIATLGSVMKDGILAKGIADQKIFLVPNAVGGDFLQTPGTHAAAKIQLGLEPKLRYVGTISSLVHYEGIDDLIDAFAILAPRFPELRLLIVGGGTSEPALQSQVARMGLRHRVIFTGRVPRGKTPIYHQALDVFVVPRKDLEVTRAVTPLKPVEAMASCRPVVASDLPAIAEIVEDGVTGRLTRPGDPSALAKTIESCLNSEQLRNRLGMQGREFVLNHRTWSSNAKLFQDVYNRITEKQK